MTMALYHTRKWRQVIRPEILRRDNYTCQMCGALLKGGRSDRVATILRPGVIDHLIPLELRPDLATDRRNLWAICCDCHDGPCQAIERRMGASGEAIRMAKLEYAPIGADGYKVTPSGRAVEALGCP